MDKEFKKLKRRSKSGEDLEDLRRYLRYDLGTHKATKLQQAGIGKTRTLLNDEVAKTHGYKLFIELDKHSKRLGSSATQRLRFLTVLHSTEDLYGDDVLEAAKTLSGNITSILNKVSYTGLWSRGTIELEVVNLEILRKISANTDSEARKLNVLESLRPILEGDIDGLHVRKLKDNATRVLVHSHSVIDLGADYEANEIKLRKLLNRTYPKAYQVELKNLFRNRTTAKNLEAIAKYVTKGGNETLRYNAGFGRDLGSDLEAKIWRKGSGKKARRGETVEDERGLTVGEVQRLNELYRSLMDTRSDRRGYLVATTG